MDYQNQIVREDMCELAKEHLPFEKLKGSSVLVTGASDRKSTRLNSSHITRSRMPSSA